MTSKEVSKWLAELKDKRYQMFQQYAKTQEDRYLTPLESLDTEIAVLEAVLEES